jgi:glycosyltransferase involved in cell wall biosynthesis
MIGDVSVIISHFNKAKFLEQALISAINQTVPPKEVIVVDDCSRDGQQNKARGLCERLGARFISRGANGGPGAARNDGIKASRGEWIQILDADDYLTRKSLEVRLEAISQEPSTLWVAGQIAKVPWFVTPHSLESRLLQFLPWFKLKPESVIEPPNVPSDSPWKVRWPHVTILFRRILFKKYGLYDEMVRLGQDKEIRWRFWYFSKTIPLVVSDIVYVYRRGHKGELTHKSNNPQRRISHDIMLANIQRRKAEGLIPDNTSFLE